MTDVAGDRNALAEQARQTFRERFGYEPQACGVAPGRVELLGNHTDYNEGFVLPAAIDRCIAVAGSMREGPQSRLASALFEGFVTFDAGNPTLDARANWADYSKGVVRELNLAGGEIGNFDAVIVSSIPTGAGVSSSAALLVSTAHLLLTLYPRLRFINGMELAQLCRRAENNFVGAPVGLLDQFSSVFGRAGHALFMDCRTLEHRAVRLPEREAAILIADTGVKHVLASGGGYTERRAQCEAAAAWFAEKTGQPIKTLRDVSPKLYEEFADEIDPVLGKRARHIVYENLRVEMVAMALEAGNLPAFGETLSNTHVSCRRFFENSCDEVDALVQIAERQEGVYGAKLTGGGWGGCAVIVHHPDAAEALSEVLVREYAARFGSPPALLPTVAAQGAESLLFD